MNMEEYYGSLASDILQAAEKSKLRWLKGNKRLMFPALISSALAIKSYLRSQLVDAYSKGDKQKLAELNKYRVERLLEMVNRLWRYHRTIPTYFQFTL